VFARIGGQPYGGNNYFVDATIQEGVFEEILVWSSSNTLFSKMISAGQLP
jgi:hypothetical protein